MCNTVLVPPSEATIKYKRIQIAQGPSCETDPLSPFGDFVLSTPIAVGVNLTCISSKLVKKHSSMRDPISKIFSKRESKKLRHCLKLPTEYFCSFALISLQREFGALTGTTHKQSPQQVHEKRCLKAFMVVYGFSISCPTNFLDGGHHNAAIKSLICRTNFILHVGFLDFVL